LIKLYKGSHMKTNLMILAIAAALTTGVALAGDVNTDQQEKSALDKCFTQMFAPAFMQAAKECKNNDGDCIKEKVIALLAPISTEEQAREMEACMKKQGFEFYR